MERALTKRAVAERLGCSVQTVARLVKAGQLKPPRQISPGRSAFLESEVDQFLVSRPTGPLTARTAAANAARESAA